MAIKKTLQQQTVDQTDSVIQPEYTREELLAGSEALFAVKPEVLSGALHGNAALSLTIEETGRLIRQFQQRKVQR